MSGERLREDRVCEGGSCGFCRHRGCCAALAVSREEAAPGFGKEGWGESQLSAVQLDGLFGFPAAALEVELMFAPCPASNWWSSGGSPVAPLALEAGDSPQLPLFGFSPAQQAQGLELCGCPACSAIPEPTGDGAAGW